VSMFLLAAVALAAPTLTLHVDATPQRTSSSGCIFVIRNAIVGGGRQTTCLTSIDGVPAAGAVIRSRGTTAFALARGTLRARIATSMRFGADAVHATQTATGTIVGGTRAYAGARGSLTGGGTVIDRRSGLGRVRLVYRVMLRA